MSGMDYRSVTEWLYGLEAEGIKFGLENTVELLRRVGDPHLELTCIHVAGTNGKGSTCAMLESVLRHAGLRTGLYTSPHLLEFTERIRVDGRELERTQVESLAAELRPHVLRMAEEGKRLTFFEVTTVMAFLHFHRSDVDMVVVETGMGGRLDATNVILPKVSVITSIDMEHSHYLGSTLAAIASEKAGIIKAGRPVVTSNGGEALEVIRARAKELGSGLHEVSQPPYLEVVQERGPTVVQREGRRYELGLRGAYQVQNAALVIEALRVLDHPRVDEHALRSGLREVRWPARLEQFGEHPAIFLDSTHNPSGAMALAQEIPHLGSETVMVLGILQDKDAEAMCRILGPMVKGVVIAEASTDRAMAADRLAKVMGAFNQDVSFEECIADAMLQAIERAGPEGTVLVTGSIYLAGDALRWLKAR
ncbi:MAG: folylpolyglutamate synthase/dihydrofolate synthase family protein [Candidatus Methanomethylophilaceae archaeon]